jgi:hypothetical protein
MDTRTRWSHILVIVGLMGMVVGTIDPLEGAFVLIAVDSIHSAISGRLDHGPCRGYLTADRIFQAFHVMNVVC